jgi:sulfite reductase beta subunit-like hemoprotein
MARMKFLIRDRGSTGCASRSKGIRRHPGKRRHRLAGTGARRLRRIPIAPATAGQRRAAAGGQRSAIRYAWLARKPTSEQKQTGYAAVTVKVEQGNLTGDQMRALARIAAMPATAWCASPSTRTWCWDSFRWAAGGRACGAARLGLGDSGAREIGDVITCPGAYTCNLASPRP